MDAEFSIDELRFRDEVRSFFDENLTPDLRRAGRRLTSVYADGATMRAWQSILHRKGWVAPAWPAEYGGCGWAPVYRYIFASELAAADAPPLSPMGLGMCGPVLIGHGIEQQRAYYLPRILSGEDFWCQGYSEAGAGSDLAALQMKAMDDGDRWICNGHKIWTTHAMLANRMFCLVRTSNEGPPQRGITFLLIDMTAPGIEVRPITMLSGENIQCQVTFRDVAVPKKNAVGLPGEGWAVAKYLLQFERGGSVFAPTLRGRLRRVRTLASDCNLDEDSCFQNRLAEIETAIRAFEYTELRAMKAAQSSAPASGTASMLKIRATELSQSITELALAAAGPYAMPFQPQHTSAGGGVDWPFTQHVEIGPDGCASVGPRYFNERAGSIYGGSNEIQRNIISRTVLGL